MAFDHDQLSDALLRASRGRCRYQDGELRFVSSQGEQWRAPVGEDALRSWLQRLALLGDAGVASSELTEHDAVARRAVQVLDGRAADGAAPLRDIASAPPPSNGATPRPWHVRHDRIDRPGRGRR